MFTFLRNFFKKNHPSLNAQAFKDGYTRTKGAVLLDVRTPQEFAGGSIKGARNINIMSRSFEQQVKTLDKNKAYFVFCQSGARSSRACRQMANMGLRVHNLKGGLVGWKD